MYEIRNIQIEIRLPACCGPIQSVCCVPGRLITGTDGFVVRPRLFCYLWFTYMGVV